jgi:hypothetical protein
MPVNFSTTFVNLASGVARVSFETQFSQMQNTLIRRFNDDVDRIADDPITRIKANRLRREGEKLEKALPIIKEYKVGMKNTEVALTDTITAQLADLQSALGPDDSVSQAEVDAFTAQRDIVASQIENLFTFTNLDVFDGDFVLNLKKELDGLNALAPAVGTKSGDAANIAAIDFVTSLQGKVATASGIASNAVASALDIELRIQAQLANVQVDIIELEVVDLERKEAEIADLQADIANFLRIISLAFERNSEITSNITDSLNPTTPDSGSILSILT